MCSSAGHTTCLVRGSPIRTSSDQRSVGSSPRLNAASHVLHRLLVPRHPPCALTNLAASNEYTHTQPAPHGRPAPPATLDSATPGRPTPRGRTLANYKKKIMLAST